MNLSEVESQIMDVLTLHSPDWKINPDIAIQIGRMHNYCAKILAQLINKGLAESRYVVEDGKQQTYKEYRLKQDIFISDQGDSASTESPEIPPQNDSDGKLASKVDRINNRLSPEDRKSLIERCRKILMGYPEGHREGENIKVQILELGGKV